MTRYIIRRLLWGVLLLILVSALTFLLFRILPTGNPARLRAGHNASPKDIAEISRDLGLNKPLIDQFWIYMKGIFLHFNLGYSYYSTASVRSLIAERLPATMSLVVGASVIWLVTGLSVGIVSAVRRGSKLDRGAMGTALLLVSAPEYWLGLILLYLFANDIGRIKVFPGAGSYVGFTSDPWRWFTSLILPWLVLAGGQRRDLRAADPRQHDRGDGRGLHPHRPRQGPQRAPSGAAPRPALGRQPDRDDLRPRHRGAARRRGARGNVFDIPGIGRLSYEAITHSDFPIIQGTVLVAALFIIVANIVVDIAYAYLDPRVHYS